MGFNSIELLAFLYAVIFVIFMIYEIFYIIKIRKIRIISCIRFMYTIIYGFVPMVIYWSGNALYFNISFYDTTISYILFILSIMGYLSLNFGYCTKFLKKRNKKTFQMNNRDCTDCLVDNVKNIYISGIIIMMIGFVSLLLWTKAFGSPFGIIPYASLIRSRYSPIYNSLAFMKHPSGLIMYSSYIFFLLLNDKKYNRFITLLLFVFSMFWSAVYLLSTDGRMVFITYFAIFILYKITNSKKIKENGIRINTVIKIAAFSLCLFVLMTSADYLFNYIKHGTLVETASENNKIIKMINQELGYTLLSGHTALKALNNNLAGNKIFMDLQAGLFAYIPNRFKPSNTMSLSSYNTMLVNSPDPGTIPTDLISMSIYDLGIIGVITIPLFFGFIVRKIDEMFERHNNSKYYSMLSVLLSMYLSIRGIAYAEFELLLLSMFYILCGHTITIIVSRIRI